MRKLNSPLFALLLLVSSSVWANTPGKLVLVMDDLGNQHRSGLMALELPWVTTVAIMPGRPYSRQLAEAAQNLNKEIILHAPMANAAEFPLGPMGLDPRAGKVALQTTLADAIATLPEAKGVSNHMGSSLTQNAEAMGWVMEVLRDHELFFFDSRTVANTQGWQAAQSASVPWQMREYFLDHYRTEAFMSKQWQKAISRAQSGETVTVICHPYPETLKFLQRLELTESDRALLVPLSQVLNHPERVKEPMPDYRNVPVEG